LETSFLSASLNGSSQNLDGFLIPVSLLFLFFCSSFLKIQVAGDDRFAVNDTSAVHLAGSITTEANSRRSVFLVSTFPFLEQSVSDSPSPTGMPRRRWPLPVSIV